MEKADYFKNFVDALCADESVNQMVNPELKTALYDGFGDSETLELHYVTSLIDVDPDRSIAFKSGVVAFTSDSIYFFDNKTLIRKSWSKISEYFFTHNESRRKQEIVLAIDQETAMHFKCSKGDIFQIESCLSGLRIRKGLDRDVTSGGNLLLRIFQDDMLDQLEKSEEIFKNMVPNEVRRKYKEMPEFLTDWWWKTHGNPE